MHTQKLSSDERGEANHPLHLPRSWFFHGGVWGQGYLFSTELPVSTPDGWIVMVAESAREYNGSSFFHKFHWEAALRKP